MREPVRKAPPTTTSIKLSPKHTIEGHNDTVWSLVFLQDNGHIVSGSWDRTIRKWDCETGQLVGEPWKGGHSVLALALSPDGKIIACGMRDGSVQLRNTEGQLISEDNWTGHTDWVRSLSWSPSGGELASGSFDGTILVRNVKSGAVKVGPIKANQGWVRSIAYSPLGDKIASGGNTICIWDSYTGELQVGPIEVLERNVTSVVWSSDGRKLYSAWYRFALVFDSTSGKELHRFQHDLPLFSIALSPKHNLLACVGEGGTAQLLHAESLQPIRDSLANKEARNEFHCVSFSPDGRYLAYGGYDNKITLWTVEDINNPPIAALSTKSRSLPLDVDDTNPLAQSAVLDEHGHNDPYNTFFTSPPSPLPNSTPGRRLKRVLHLQQKLSRHRAIQHRAPFTSPPANSEQPESTPKGNFKAVNKHEERLNVNSSENVVPRSTQRESTKSKQRGEPTSHVQTYTPHDLSSPAKFDSINNRMIWNLNFRRRKDDNDKADSDKASVNSRRVACGGDDSDPDLLSFWQLLFLCGH